jgi:hypothetical protein
MRRRDHPQVGDIWATADQSIFFTVLRKTKNIEEDRWDLTILVEGDIKHASVDKDFKDIEGVYWKVA